MTERRIENHAPSLRFKADKGARHFSVSHIPVRTKRMGTRDFVGADHREGHRKGRRDDEQRKIEHHTIPVRHHKSGRGENGRAVLQRILHEIRS